MADSKLAERNSARAWLIGILTFCAGVAALLAMFKINPAMDALLTDLGETATFGGSLSSVFAITAAILIIPFGALAVKVNVKWLVVGSTALLAIGGILESTTTNSAMFMAYRLLEAVGYTGMFAFGPVMITRWFTEDKRGIPMGLWTAMVGVGSTVVMQMASATMPTGGWHVLWIAIGIVCAVICVLYVVVAQHWPKGAEAEAAAEAAAKAEADANAPKVGIVDTFKIPVLWGMAAIFLCFGVGMQGIMTFSVSILTQQAGVDPVTANNMSSVMSMGQIVSPLIGGWIISMVCKKNKKMRAWVLLVFLAMAFVFEIGYFACVHDTVTAWIFSILCGFVAMWGPGFYILAADHAPSESLSSVCITIFLFGQFLGGIIGPAVLGFFMDMFGGFASAMYMIVALAVIAVVILVLLARADQKLVESQEK